MNIYVTGPNGRLGSQLVAMGAIPIYDNILQPETSVPDDAVIINCAAATDVDRCEDDEDYYLYACDVNGRGVSKLSDSYPDNQIIHLSTDYIFGGRRGPYREDYFNFTVDDEHIDDLVPKTCGYGFTKFFGESFTIQHNNIFVVRTTGLYGGVSGKHDFVKMVVDRLSHKQSICVTKELHGNQTYIPHLAEALLEYASMPEKEKVLHIASQEVISRYKFALMIASVWGLDKDLIFPCTNKEVPGWIATRPKKGGLQVNLARKLGLPIYTILEGLEDAKIKA